MLKTILMLFEKPDEARVFEKGKFGIVRSGGSLEVQAERHGGIEAAGNPPLP